MATKLIELQDNVYVEVEASPKEPRQISYKYAEKVGKNLQSIKTIIVKTCRPVIEAWEELSKEMKIDQSEIELGISFESEGNIYLTRASAEASFKIKLLLKPKE